MTCRYAVTFEFDMRPPLTHRGVVEGGRAQTCVARATKLAQTASSLSAGPQCVLLERLEALAPRGDATVEVEAREDDNAND